MKLTFITLVLALLALQCSNKKTITANCYKGRLEIKGICMNYTIKLLDGSIDTARISSRWTDEHTGREYTNVFGLGSPCDFSANIKEGEEFYFAINNTSTPDCAVCQAYYPTPPKKLSIGVLPQPCTQ